MRPTQPPKKERIVMQRMTPDQFDVVLGAHPARQPAKKGLPLVTLAILLGLVAAVVFLAVQLFHVFRPTHVSVPVTVAAPEPLPEAVREAPALPQNPSPSELRTTEHVVYTAPKAEAATASTNRPLDTCLKDGNVIDRDVINCRFGDAQPTDYNAPRPQGMVSDRYMAEYKSAAAKPKAETGRRYEVAGVFIREIDGRNRYEARYRIYNNHIENSSVCMNFKSDSVEFRECRRAAEPFFKDMCSDWTRKTAKDKNEKNQMAQEQYCEAARTYQP